MIHYPDTSFLCSLYRKQVYTAKAVEQRATMAEPLFFTDLLEFEFLQGVELQVWLHTNDRAKGFDRHQADQMIADWEADIAAGLNIRLPADETAVLHFARSLSRRHTASGGHRTLDVLHVATAVHLGARRFLTFDARQRTLAQETGLELLD